MINVRKATQEEQERKPDQVQDRNFHHALIEIGSPVLYDFDGYHFLSFEVLTFNHLSKGTLTKDIKYQIPVSTAGGQQTDHSGSDTIDEAYLCPLSSLPRMSLT